MGVLYIDTSLVIKSMNDGSPMGEMFKMTGYNPSTKQDTFTRILPDSPVFPGPISWWGIISPTVMK